MRERINREHIFQLAAYCFVAFMAVGLAFAISMKFIARSYSQGALPAKGAPAAAEEAAAPVAQDPNDVSDLQGFLEPFIYDANNRRDPFQPYVEFRDNSGPQQNTAKYDVDDFKLVGIMWDNHDPKAMFVDPDQKVYVVGRDESIGRRNGYVAAIREGEVVVVESQRKQGDIVYKTKVIPISR